MGTGSTIAFIERRTNREGKVSETELVRVYQQYDGYLRGVGKELATWLSNKTLVNGFSANQTDTLGYCNGMGCMAAQFIRDFKVGIGNLYIITANDTEDYNYRVIEENGEITVEVRRWDDSRAIFRGSPLDMIDFINEGYVDD